MLSCSVLFLPVTKHLLLLHIDVMSPLLQGTLKKRKCVWYMSKKNQCEINLIMALYLVPYLPDQILWVCFRIHSSFFQWKSFYLLCQNLIRYVGRYPKIQFSIRLMQYSCRNQCIPLYSLYILLGEINIFSHVRNKTCVCDCGWGENLVKGTIKILLRPRQLLNSLPPQCLSLFQHNSGSLPMLYLFPFKARHFHQCRFLPIICLGTSALLQASSSQNQRIDSLLATDIWHEKTPQYTTVICD